MELVDLDIDFLALVASMGLPARRVDGARHIAPALQAGIASHTAKLVEIPVNADH